MTSPDKGCNSNLHYIDCDVNDPKDLSDNLLYFGYINAQSVREKSDEIKKYINEHDIDSLLITETWLRPNDTKLRGDLEAAKFTLKDVLREGMTGGGVGILSKGNVRPTQLRHHPMSTFENIEVIITSGNIPVRILLVYR